MGAGPGAELPGFESQLCFCSAVPSGSLGSLIREVGVGVWGQHRVVEMASPDGSC